MGKAGLVSFMVCFFGGAKERGRERERGGGKGR